MMTKYALPIVAAGLLIFAAVHVSRNYVVTPPAHPVADPPRNTAFTHTVAGAGMVEPRTENIAIGSPVSGVVVEVKVVVGQKVRKGEELFRLDARQLNAELKARDAALQSAQSDLARLENQPRKEQVPVSEADVTEAEANLADQRDQLNRARDLAPSRAVSAQELVAREQAFRMSQSRLMRAKASLDLLKAGAWEFDKLVARAAVEQAEAQVAQTKTELDRLVVRALVDGEVLQVNVRPGEFVGAPANQALVVLGDVEQLHVRVDIDEHDIPRFNEGASARALLKGRSDQEFPLKFVRVEPYVVPKKSITGENTERVDTRVLQVIYSIDSKGRKLYVGQQMDVFIDGAEKTDAKPI
jgi:multidrug resistance efflux pump